MSFTNFLALLVFTGGGFIFIISLVITLNKLYEAIKSLERTLKSTIDRQADSLEARIQMLPLNIRHELERIDTKGVSEELHKAVERLQETIDQQADIAVESLQRTIDGLADELKKSIMA